MSFGPLTILEQLSQKLLIRWVPKWYEVFRDSGQENFHERLTRGFKPVPLGYRRLLTQCRQLAMYSHASRQKGLGFDPDLKSHFRNLKAQFYVPASGGWRFSIDDQGQPADGTYDLYATSFVIFALTHYYRATRDEDAHHLALETLKFIDHYFRMPGLPGYAEALDHHLKPIPKLRRQNPHMHLLEACLFASDVWSNDLFKTVADEMVGLFVAYFYDPAINALCEWFTDDLQPDPDKGDIVEPGHYFEWVWLLKKHAAKTDDPHIYDAICYRLLDWANTHGWDTQFGGIYDEIKTDGTVVGSTKRIWPFTEALKANALMLMDHPAVKQARKDRIAEMVRIFRDKYIEERGFWTERLNRDLSPATDYMPGTTPYHVYFGIMETRDILRARGRGKSPVPLIYGFFYRLRRKVSSWMKQMRQTSNR